MNFLEDWLDDIYKEFKPTHIPIDYDGIGRGPVDNLMNRRGWTQIIPIQNGSSAHRSHLYLNRGTELYAETRRLIEARAVKIDGTDDKMINQLTSRRIMSGNKGKKILESKKQAKARGVPSPDRSDSLVLALSVHSYESLVVGRQSLEEADKEHRITIRSDADLMKFIRNQYLKPTQKWKALNF